ncbi:MAG: LysM peptidoglycan-binding domain-containing protein [Clostridia bacterium]|nr:MAG: LysM peptidoglycan-binding domain-containing protein [Clostridia bacterium]
MPYNVKSGDTVASIAQKYGQGEEALLAANPQLEGREAEAGEVVWLPWEQEVPREIRPIPLDPRLLRLDGISAEQIRQHFEILYVGYVNKVNEIRQQLRTANRQAANPTYSEFRGLKKGETYAMDGVKLHEYYFNNLGGSGGRPGPRLLRALERFFGSYQRWEEDFRAVGLAARGWAVLSLDDRDQALHNYLLDSHDHGVVVMTKPILVLDVYEHAYFLDYGAHRAPYIEAFFRNIRWEVAERRWAKVGAA